MSIEPSAAWAEVELVLQHVGCDPERLGKAPTEVQSVASLEALPLHTRILNMRTPENTKHSSSLLWDSCAIIMLWGCALSLSGARHRSETCWPFLNPTSRQADGAAK